MTLKLIRLLLIAVFILQQTGSMGSICLAAPAEAPDDLDQYFEDYFEEETPPQQDAQAQEEVEPQKLDKQEPQVEPVKAERQVKSTPAKVVQEKKSIPPITSSGRDEAISKSLSAEIEKQTTDQPKTVQDKVAPPSPAESDAFEFSLAKREQAAEYEMVSVAKDRKVVGTEGVDIGVSYLDAAEVEGDSFEQLLENKRQYNRHEMMDRIADFLIGEEVDRPTLHIRGSQTKEVTPAFKTLQEAIEEATDKHLPIEIAKEKVLLYRRHINKAMRDLFPSAVVSYADTRQTLGNGPDTTTLEDDFKISVRQPLYQGGGLWNKVREEKSNLKSAMAEYKKIFADLALEVATAYFNLSKTKTMLGYREGLLVKANKALSLSEEKFKANLISEIEHLNVQSQQSQINSSLQQSREEIELAMLEVQKSMNLDIDEPIDVYNLEDYFNLIGGEKSFQEEEKPSAASGAAEETKDTKAEEAKINELIRMAYENRPEFVIGEYKVKARRYAEKAQKGAWLPQLSLFTEFGQNKEILAFNGEPGDKFEDEFRVGVEASWNVFGNTVRYLAEQDDQPPSRSGFSAGGKGDFRQSRTLAVGILDNLEQYSKAQEAEVATKEAILEFELSEKDMISEVKESYYNFNRAKIQMKSVLKKIKYREKLVELASHRSEINEIQLSEYLQAEIDLVEERNTFYQAMVDFFVARASLNKAIGISNFLNVEKLPLDLLR